MLVEGSLSAYPSELPTAVGGRFKNQVDESSKVLAEFDVLPEMLHNEVRGWKMLEDGFADSISFVLPRGCEAEAEQFNRLTSLIREGGGKGVYEISLTSPTRLAAVLATTYYCDYVSFYLAMARGVDPTPIDTIQLLKGSTRFPSD